ncbi:hypothetical protein GobsT_52160 [Gemmata obscuriglobus]|uniref:PepSY domain-containing protein n=1 Tax=Gemmata obscuriglobus TaxID=114 RepID=A0A2Z3GT18_9BACT|nr:PepSY domain-containing protein [Gemmata obscuriglobus]AWM36913.1 hypothetical protein C1280_07685 [Gemmata obscuriglobus]QEG30411.1 hypothetical protein GobsT_52160 [Gemmata obscuriglobus]VTS09735.1 Uncharacterized protein OS=Singulisphaera acidiphila (strain ATCC BAA-1392 / DSM 18658 / VKM B-2454 / MOB10) GN=Sinac_6475 PE=4 SV=1: PepSY_TM_1 [Gemmata obscuriglobus UQM 2246]
MSVAEPPAPDAGAGYDRPAPQVKRRPLGKRVMHVVRRAHLYLGLFLLPWAVLYGFTGFLFNHPTAFSDAPSVSFGATELAGTPMEAPPKPAELAAQVVAALNERAKGEHAYTLVEPEKAKYTRDLAFATAKAEGQDVNIAIDVNSAGGTVRSRNAVAAQPKSEEKAPFAVSGTKGGRGEKGGGGRGEKGGGRGERGEKGGGGSKGEPAPSAAPPQTGLQLPEPLHERVKSAARTVLERTGFPTDELTVTSVPDLTFRMSEGEKVWTVTYNAQSGTVNGASAGAPAPPEELSTRRFLTRLHTAHGFPGSTNARWFWAVIVDVMAFVMVFWGVSGVFMWWQLKATRKLGFALVLFGACVALALGFGMHDLMTAR